MRRASRLLGGAMLVLGVVVALAAPAAAHAQLVSTTPAAGAVLDAPPTSATVRFGEAVQVRPDGLQLHDAQGRRVDDGGVRRVEGDRAIRLPLHGLGNGGYILTWRVVSADGHPVSGGVTWRVGASSTGVDQTLLQQLLDAEGGDWLVRVVAAVVRTVLFGALLLLIGGLAFLVLVWPEGADDRWLRATLRASAVVAAAGTVVGMGLQGADVAGLGLTHAFGDLGTSLDTLSSSYGQAAVARLALLVGVVVLLARLTPARLRQAWWQLAAGVGAAGLALTLTAAGHARTGRWVPLALPFDLVHVLAASTWIGGLAVLTFVVLPERGGGDEADARPRVSIVARFSTVALAAVGTLVVTGTVQGLRQLGHLESLRDTSYGRLLVLKVVAVAVVVVLGARSRSWLQGRDADVDVDVDVDVEDDVFSDVERRRLLRRSVGAEAVVSLVVLALTSLLVAADPARTLENKAFDAAKVVHGTVLEVVAAPDRTGPVDFHVYATDPSLGLTVPLTFAAVLSLPSRGITGITVPLRSAGRTHWSAYDVDVPIRGRWRIAVTMTIGSFDERQATFEIPIN